MRSRFPWYVSNGISVFFWIQVGDSSISREKSSVCPQRWVIAIVLRERIGYCVARSSWKWVSRLSAWIGGWPAAAILNASRCCCLQYIFSINWQIQPLCVFLSFVNALGNKTCKFEFILVSWREYAKSCSRSQVIYLNRKIMIKQRYSTSIPPTAPMMILK